MTTDIATRPRRRGFDFKDFGILGGLLAIIVYLSLSTTTFLSGQNIVNLLDQAVVIGLLAVGATLCIVSGVFDLSSSATLAVSAIAGVFLTTQFGVPMGFVLALGVGAILGTITGTMIVLTRVNSFIGSLAISIIYRGLAIVLTGGPSCRFRATNSRRSASGRSPPSAASPVARFCSRWRRWSSGSSSGERRSVGASTRSAATKRPHA